tara:strand:+ start:2719 stop:2961 length:243 start_codon:yes stop_codon:yes gene_type:complete
MKAKIFISLKEGILDPQGSTVNKALDSVGIDSINSIRMGKYIEMEFSSKDKDQISSIVKQSCNKLLVNPNTETYTFSIED